MMSPIHYLLFIPPTLLGSFYLGKKLEREISTLLNRKTTWLYWGILFVIFFISTVLLSPIMVFLLYSCLLFFLLDIITFLFRKLHFNAGNRFLEKLTFHEITIFFLATIFTLFGLYNASHPIVRQVTLTLEKEITTSFKIVMLTDLHLGTGTNQDSIDQIVRQVTQENADLFVLVGDIFDEHTTQELKDYAYRQFGTITSTYGSFYVEGNHDLLTDEMREEFRKYQITVLEDEVRFIDQSFYLIGRLDRKEKRKELATIVQEVDFQYPVILLNHRPDDIKNAKQLGVDLQLSGHTHAGQLFPANFILQHGYYRFDDYHLVVSPGYGNWGIPIRTSGRNELVVITVNGKK